MWFWTLTLAAALELPLTGQLTDPTGAPVHGAHEITFRLYSPSAVPELVWDETAIVDFQQGAFAVRLGAVDPLAVSLFSAATDLALTVQLTSGAESPRTALGWSPYAARAEWAANAATLDGHPLADFTLDAESVAWSRLSNVPTGLADGDDNTTYGAGTGITLSAGAFSFNATTAESALKSVLDDDYAFTAGSGLTLSGRSFQWSATGAEVAMKGVLDDDYVNEGAPITLNAGAHAANAITVTQGRVLLGNGAGVASHALELRSTTQEPFIALTRPTSGNDGGIHFQTGDSTARKWTVKHPAGADRLDFVDATNNQVLSLNQGGGVTVPGTISRGACKAGYTKCGRLCAKIATTATSVWTHQDTARSEGADVANYRETVEVAYACASNPAFTLPNPGVWLAESCGDYGTAPRTMNLYLPGPLTFTGCTGDSLDCYGIDYVFCERIQSNPNGRTNSPALYVYRVDM